MPTIETAAADLEAAALQEAARLEAAARVARERAAEAAAARAALSAESAADARAANQARRLLAAPAAWRAVLDILEAESALIDRIEAVAAGLAELDRATAASQAIRIEGGADNPKAGLVIREPIRSLAYAARQRRPNLEAARRRALAALAEAERGEP